MIFFPAGKSRHRGLKILLMILLSTTGFMESRAFAQSDGNPQSLASDAASTTAAPALPNTDESAATNEAIRPSAELPDAPVPVRSDSPAVAELSRSSEGFSHSAFPDFMALDATPSVISTRAPGYVGLEQCPDDFTHSRSCRVHWHQL